MTVEMQRPRPDSQRLAALTELARERDDEPDMDYPELVALLEADSCRQQRRRRRRA